MDTAPHTTPPSTPSSLPIPESTPHSRGSASHAQTLFDERAGNPKNIENVAYDLKSRERCSFIAMLEALMLRQIMMLDSNRAVFEATAEERETVHQKFKTYLDDAVRFVNGRKGSDLRENLQTYCDTRIEKARYLPFVNVLNETLLYFRKERRQVEDEDIIFAINDPVVIQSTHLPESTKRKPDLICLLAQRFRLLHEDCENHGFDDCVTIASKGNDPKSKAKKATCNWGDILQPWELEAKESIKLEIRTDFKVEEFLGMNEEPPVTSISRDEAHDAGGAKRKRGSESIPSSKKFKVDEQLYSLMPRAPKDVQCAFYGIERLRHSMDITHSMSVLLSDAKLTLFWYDSQGCIEADTINIVQELPLLVVMIGIFQNFPLGLWGCTPIDVWTEGKNNTKVPYRREENPVGSFQIIGRRTFTADTTKIQPNQAQTATASTVTSNARRSIRLIKQPLPSSSSDVHSDDILFLKSAWPETARRKEPEVIQKAYKRAGKLLGTEARSVTDHLPVLISFEELAYTSTEIIRRLVGSTTTGGFRVQLWMLSKKLRPIHVLSPSDFWTAFWHTLRCHTLLWRIGIAHGDVSLYNLMYNEDNKHGVLNDFDLSTIMKPGSPHPNRQGLERTGTLPFMATELLHEKGFGGKTPRRYRHELESFAWVLVWVSRCVVDGKESERPSCMNEWLGNSNRLVYMSKLAFIRDHREIPTTPDYESLGMVIESWVDIWDSYQQQLAKRARILFTEKTDTEHLHALIAACKECGEEYPMATVPIDLTWVNGLADLKFTALGPLPTPPLDSATGKLPAQHNSDGPPSSDGGNRDISDDDTCADDDSASLPNDTEFGDTDSNDDHQSDRDLNTNTNSESHGMDS